MSLYLSELDVEYWRVSSGGACQFHQSRYAELPVELVEFLGSFSEAETKDEKSWLISSADFSSVDESGFSFNEIEKMSLMAAEDDLDWRLEIELFWDKHIPLYISVRNTYEFIAYNIECGTFVEGGEPEFEETSCIASSIKGFLKYINKKNTI